MQSRVKDSASAKTRDRERVLLDWANSSQDNSLPAVEELVAGSGSQLSQRSSTLKNEMQELARWLEEGESLRDDPWKSAASSRGMSGSPTNIDDGEETSRIEQNESLALGFDDDFTVFVSAPAVEPTESSGRSTPDAPPGGLSVAPGGDLYRSLGSVSDFGGSDDGRDADEDTGADDGLPTKKEILATSSRIFGSAKFPPPPAMKSRSTTVTPASREPPTAVKAPPQVLSDSDSELESFATEGLSADDDGSYDMEPFDLSKVLSALQEMKTEIAGMEDEGERRKAAARVALGLVYGLEADTEPL
ncbi:hypothetical protein DXG03_004923 [Asterophora parasitica]|uniref:Uncharacterized protein n=1 Tax=Asterophora parasitica TaxID=117018 RepID=A0A9P7GEA0_9AGAR|nr:hypothetical protein DXG03_004923 [Asterophora parasitica]